MTQERIKTLTTPQLTVRTVGGLPSIDLTTDDVDAMGDRVLQGGLTFRSPLPIMFAHQYDALPVGQATAATIQRGPHRTRVAWRWLEGDARAAAVRNAFEQGFLGASIGMRVHETRPNEHGGVDIVRAEGIEGSLTATPANPACTRLLKDLGWSRGQRADDEEIVIELIDDDDGDVLVLDLDLTGRLKMCPPNPSGAGRQAEDAAWAAPALKDFTDKAWGALSVDERRAIGRHFAFAASWPPESYGDLHLPHHDPASHDVNARACRNALARLNQVGGMSADDRDAARGHLEAHLEQFKSADIDIDPREIAQAVAEFVSGEFVRQINKLRGRID